MQQTAGHRAVGIACHLAGLQQLKDSVRQQLARDGLLRTSKPLKQIAAEVAKNPNGIGYVGLAYIHDPGIKALPIDGQLPAKDSVRSGSYPYSRPTFYYTNGEPSGEAAKFVAFTLSDEGQKISDKIGFVPIK